VEQVEKQGAEGSDPHGGLYVREIGLCFGVRRARHWVVELKRLFFRWL
jgi:hypothetical protein